MASDTFSRRKTVLFSIVAVLFSGFLVLLLGEVAARWLNRVRGDGRELSLFVENPNGTGSFRTRPNFYAELSVEGQDVVIDVNSHGMHWREVAIEKPPGRKRIAFLGDSFTFGLWASDYEKSLVGVFDSLMADSTFEILNFGVDGYGFADMELLLREEVIQFDPDYIVVMAYNGNDFYDTYFGLHRYDVSTGVAHWKKDVVLTKVPQQYVPQRILNPGKEESPKGIGGWLAAKSALYGRLVQLKTALRGAASPTGNRFMTTLTIPEHQFFGDSFWCKTEYPQVAQEAVAASLDVLGRMHHYASDHHIQFAVAAIPHPRQVYVNEITGPGYDLRRPQIFLQEFAADRDIPYLDLMPEIRRFAREENPDVYLYHDVHFNDVGHYLVGELVYEWFTNYVDSGVAEVPARVLASAY